MENTNWDWDSIRSGSYAAGRPPEWPVNVRAMSSKGRLLLGVDPATGKLYWDGKEVPPRFHLGSRAAFFLMLNAVSTFGIFIIFCSTASSDFLTCFLFNHLIPNIWQSPVIIEVEQNVDRGA